MSTARAIRVVANMISLRWGILPRRVAGLKGPRYSCRAALSAFAEATADRRSLGGGWSGPPRGGVAFEGADVLEIAHGPVVMLITRRGDPRTAPIRRARNDDGGSEDTSPSSASRCGTREQATP